jgi:RNA methyltransferase, TrmH family
MIVSPANSHVKHIRSLAADRKDRRRERLFVLEGVRLVADALASGAECRVALYAPEQLATTSAGQHLLARLEHVPSAYPATAAVVAAACDTVQAQGVVMVAEWPSITAKMPGLVLVLEEVQDPGNLGTLLRSAEAVGVAQVVCTQGTVDVYSPKVVRAAMGAHFRLAIEQDLGWEAVGERLAFVDHVYAAEATATMPYYAADWRQPSALILGNEARGLSETALAYAEKLIHIPMAGGAESLNVAVAGSIILFESLRQRAHGRVSI